MPEHPTSPLSITCPAQIGRDRTLLFWLDRSLTLEARPHLRFALHWLRETAAGKFAAELRKDIDAGVDACVRATVSGTFLAAVAVDEAGRLRLRISRWRAASLRVEARPRFFPDPAPVAGAIRAFDQQAPASPANGLASAICERALEALERKCAAELSRRTARGCAIFDGVFYFTPEGLAAFQSALAGDLVAAHLAEALKGEKAIEVHLPSFGRKEWPERWSALANAEAVAEEDGRVFVHARAGRERRKETTQGTLALAAPLLYPHSAPRLDIGFTNSRTGTPAMLAHALAPLLRAYDFGAEPAEWLAAAPPGDVRASLSLSVRGDLASAWLRGPGERDPTFFEVYSRVSVAVQRAMRRWVPYIYFSDIGRFGNLPEAYSLVFYRSTWAFAGRPRSEFTHDLVTFEDHGVARPWAFRPLASHLAVTERLLLAAGRKDLARQYEPWRAREVLAGIVRRPRFVNALLAADTFLIDRMVDLALAGRELAAGLAGQPRRTAIDLAAAADRFTKALNQTLGRLYGGQDFRALGSLLLVEATRALAASLDGSAAISAILRLERAGREQTFVSGDRLPAPSARPRAGL